MITLANGGQQCSDEVELIDKLKAKIQYNHAVAQFERFKSLLTLPVESIPCMVAPEEYEGESFQFRYNGWFCEFDPAVESYDDVEVSLITGRHSNPSCTIDGGMEYLDDTKTTLDPNGENLQDVRRTYGVEIDFNNPDLTFARYFEAWLRTMQVAHANNVRVNAELWDTAKEEWSDLVKERFKTMKKNANKD